MGKVEHIPKQNERILKYMDKHGSITQFEAYRLGILRLASRISDMRRLGYQIEREMVTVKNQYGENCRVARYSLERQADE